MVEITRASLYCRKTKPSDVEQTTHARVLQSILFEEWRRRLSPYSVAFAQSQKRISF